MEESMSLLFSRELAEGTKNRPKYCYGCIWLQDPDPRDGIVLSNWNYKCCVPAGGGYSEDIDKDRIEKCIENNWRAEFRQWQSSHGKDCSDES
jgi:hypothetical protein